MACAVNLFQLSQFCPLIFDLRIWFLGTLGTYSWQNFLCLFIIGISAQQTIVVLLLCKIIASLKKWHTLSDRPYKASLWNWFFHLYIPYSFRDQYVTLSKFVLIKIAILAIKSNNMWIFLEHNQLKCSKFEANWIEAWESSRLFCTLCILFALQEWCTVPVFTSSKKWKNANSQTASH